MSERGESSWPGETLGNYLETITLGVGSDLFQALSLAPTTDMVYRP